MADLALQFNGTTQYGQIPDYAALDDVVSTGNMTIEFWINTADIIGDEWLLSRSGQFDIKMFNASLGVQVASSGFAFLSTISASTNTHVVVKFEDQVTFTNVTTYVNNVKSSTAALVGLFTASSNPIGVLADSGFTNLKAGTIDELVIYNVALSDSQVTERYNSGAGTYNLPSGITEATDVVAEFHFDDGASPTDNSATKGAGQDMTLFNSPTFTSPIVNNTPPPPDNAAAGGGIWNQNYANTIFENDLCCLNKIARNSGYLNGSGTTTSDGGTTFDGNGVVVYSNPNFNKVGQGDFTVECKFKSTNTTLQYLLAVGGTSAAGGLGFGIATQNNQLLGFIHDGTRLVFPAYGSGANDGEWHSFVGVFDRDGNFTPYLDGAALTGTDISARNGILDSNNTLIIGDNSGADGRFIGTIKDVKIYNRALTTIEVADIVNNRTYSEVDFGKAIVHLPMRTTYVDGSDVKTKNIGVYQEDGTLGAGALKPSFEGIRGAKFSANDIITIPDNNLVDLDNNFTIYASVYLDDIVGSNGLIDKDSGGGALNGSHLMWLNGSVGLQCFISDGVGSNSVTQAVEKAENGIYTFVFTGDGNIMRAYVNAYSSSAATMTVTPAITTKPWVFGAMSTTGTLGFRGKIYEAGFFNYGLTQLQVKYLHHKLIDRINR